MVNEGQTVLAEQCMSRVGGKQDHAIYARGPLHDPCITRTYRDEFSRMRLALLVWVPVYFPLS